MSTSIPYREQVNKTLVALSNIGKPVWVLFQHGRKRQFFRGEITEINMKKVDDDSKDGISTVDIAHFVVFDDGEKYWYNLAEKEDAGQLVWQEPAGKSLLKNKRVVQNNMMKPQEKTSAAQLPPPVGKGQGKNKRKNDIDETNDDYYVDSYDDEIRDELNNNGNMKRARVVSSDSSDARNSDDQQEQATRQFKALSSTTKKWVNVLGLAMAYGSKHDALDIIMDNPSKYVMPEAFEQVFFLADFLFPGKDYHQTLYARYTKPGQPVRDVLVS